MEEKQRESDPAASAAAEEDQSSARRPVSRRQFLKMAGVAGAAVGLGAGLSGALAACGNATSTETTTGATAGSGGTSVSAGGETGREVKIGFVTPLTGSLASFGVPDQYCVDRAVEAIGSGIACADGLVHPVKILTMDSQSDTNRAAQVTGDLINNDKVDLIVTASTPDTVCPVADQAEAMETPCISNDCPWQAYVSTRAGGDLTATFKWTYHCFWGLEDMQANYLDMWSQLSHNKVIAVMFSNDADGQAYDASWPAALEAAGYQMVKPSLFQLNTEDFTAQIGEFKKAGCELAFGVFIPPDFTNFWKQSKQQGFTPKVGTFAKALLFPESVQALGDIGDGLTTEVWWTPSHPYKSSLLGETCQEFADKFTAAKNAQWTQPLLHFIVFEWAVDVLKRTTNVDDKEAIMAAIKQTKLETIGGVIDFAAPVETGTPYKVGPCHIHENVYKTPQVGGQWRKGTKYPYELTIVSNAAAPEIAVQGKVQPLAV